MVVLANLSTLPADALAYRVADVVLEDVLAVEPASEPEPEATPEAAPEAVTVDPAELAALAGTWVRPVTGSELRLEFEEGALFARLGSGRYRMGPLGGGRFALLGYDRSPHPRTLTAEPADGPPERLLLAGRGLSGSPRDYARVRPVTAEQLEAYAGRYRSPELAVVYRLAPADGGLVAFLEDRFGERWLLGPLLPLGDDAFAGDAASAVFRRDADGAIRGFELSEGRMRGLVFERLAP